MKLDASLSSSLDWTFPEGPVQIDFDFALSEVSLYDETAMAVFEGAIRHFFDTHYDKLEVTGVSLYQGSAHVPLLHQEYYDEWLADLGLADTPHLRRVHATDILSSYLHRLAACVPDEIEPYVLFDLACEGDPWKAAQLVSKERFTHLGVATKNGPAWLSYCDWNLSEVAAPTAGVVLPLDAYCDNLPPIPLDDYRMVPEYALTEMWDGLDTLYYVEEALSPQGKRKLRGFEVTEGKIERLTSLPASLSG